MRAVRIDTWGDGPLPPASEIERPRLADDMVLVRVACAGINFMDIGTRQGRYAKSQTYKVSLPCTLGMEGAGEVVAVGAGVSRLRVGDRVAWCLAWGSYADYAAVPESLVAQLPDGISFEQAAAAMFQGCTAHYLVNDVARMRAGVSCLVHAASGSIGQIIVQMASRLGARVIATASSAEKREVARGRGADLVLGYQDFDVHVRNATQGAGVDVVFDAVGKTTLRTSMRCTRRRGLIVNYGSVSGPVVDFDPLELGEAGSLFLTRPRLGDHMESAQEVQHRADSVFAGILEGWLKIDVAARYTLDDVGVAHDLLVSRKMIGKPILQI